MVHCIFVNLSHYLGKLMTCIGVVDDTTMITFKQTHAFRVGAGLESPLFANVILNPVFIRLVANRAY
jgi:hypothetical protein